MRLLDKALAAAAAVSWLGRGSCRRRRRRRRNRLGDTPGPARDTPADAAKQAKKDEKLVMVLHISGHFENPG